MITSSSQVDCLVSFVIPCYNIESYIRGGVIQMLLTEDIHSVEIVLVDDGSTDNTLSAIQELALKNPTLVRYISQPNMGVSKARNMGLDIARGKYICFLDADDLLKDNAVSLFVDNIKLYSEIELFVFGYQSQTESGMIRKRYSSGNLEGFHDGLWLLRNFYDKKLFVHIGSFVVKKELLSRNSLCFLEGCKYGEDLRFMIQMMQCAKMCYYNPAIVFQYVVRTSSAMAGYRFFSRELLNSFDAFKDLSQKTDLRKSENYFLSVSYMSLLILYLRYGVTDSEIQRIFQERRCYLWRPMAGFSLYHLVIYLFRLFPLRFFFWIKEQI